MNPLERDSRSEPNLSRGTALVAIDGAESRSSSHDWISQLMLPRAGTHGWEYQSVKGPSRDNEEEASPKTR